MTITTSFTSDEGDPVSGVTTEIDYPEAKVEIPGVGGGSQVASRVTNLTGVSGGLFNVGDDDDVLNVGLVSLSAEIPSGPFATAEFDCLEGEAPPAAGEFTCAATISSFLGFDVEGSCAVSVAVE